MLDNHVHFLLRTGSAPVSVFMSRLLTGYAGWFNKKYKTSWAALSESLQIHIVPGRSLLEGTGPLHPFEPIESGFGERP
jgi:hypothetical protein